MPARSIRYQAGLLRTQPQYSVVFSHLGQRNSMPFITQTNSLLCLHQADIKE